MQAINLVDDMDGEAAEQLAQRAAKRPRRPINYVDLAGSSSDEDEVDLPQHQHQLQRKQKQKKPKPASPPAKAARHKEAKEKRVDRTGRTVMFAPRPSQDVYVRIQRAMPGSAHRMFLLSSKEKAPAGAPGGQAQDFDVLGATGNVYTVTIARQPVCTCPDHQSGRAGGRCKHILFVMLRVLKLEQTNPLVWQRALLTQEVEEVLSGQHSQGVAQLAGVLAPDSVRANYQRLTGAAGEGDTAAAEGGSNRKLVDGDCPICFDELQEGEEELAWCTTCGNNIHSKCFQVWADQKKAAHASVTCVYCRAAWPDQGGHAAGRGSRAGYVNLAQYSEAHREGNTSVYALYGENAMWIARGAAGGGAGAVARAFQAHRGGRVRR